MKATYYFAYVQDLSRGKSIGIRMTLETYLGVDAELTLREHAPKFCIANDVEWENYENAVSNHDGLIVADSGQDEFFVCGPDYSKVMGYITDQFDLSNKE